MLQSQKASICFDQLPCNISYAVSQEQQQSISHPASTASRPSVSPRESTTPDQSQFMRPMTHPDVPFVSEKSNPDNFNFDAAGYADAKDHGP